MRGGPSILCRSASITHQSMLQATPASPRKAKDASLDALVILRVEAAVGILRLNRSPSPPVSVGQDADGSTEVKRETQVIHMDQP